MRTYTTDRGQARARIGEGLRRLTPGLIKAEHRAIEMAETPLPARHELRHAVSILRTASFLTAAEAETLNVLIDLCGTWESEGVPIVFATNRRLRSRMSGVNSDRAICARLASLGRRGLICHVERPGSRRGVEIDPETGEKVYYGISLLPLAAILPEAKRIEAQREAEYTEKSKHRRRVRSSLSRIEALVSTAIDLGLNPDEWNARYDMAVSVYEIADPCEDLCELRNYADQLADIRAVCAEAIEECLRFPSCATNTLSVSEDGPRQHQYEPDSGYPESRIHPKTINKPITDKSEHCTHSTDTTICTRSVQDGDSSTDADCVGLENKPGSRLCSVNFRPTDQAEMFETPSSIPSLEIMTPVGSDISSIDLIRRELEKYQISPDHLVTVSEGLAAYLPYGSEDDPEWKDIAAAAFSLRAVIGLSERGWQRAVKVLGVTGATVAMAIATAEVNRPKIRKSSAEYIVWMAKFTEDGGSVGFGAKMRSALSRTRMI